MSLKSSPRLKIIASFMMLFIFSLTQAQQIKTGELFPDLIIRPVINAPVKQFDVSKENKKLLILNFWGTWCAPCLPEMDSLAVLQEKNKSKIQVIAISNETTDRLQNYLRKKPSKLWLASDTSGRLYSLFSFNYVGQCAIIDAQNHVVTITRADSVNQQLIDKLLRNEMVKSYGDAGNRRDLTEKDLFGIDSTITSYVSLSSYRANIGSMGKSYPNTVYENRRRTYLNVCPEIMYKDAYDIHSTAQVVYEAGAKEVCDFKKKIIWCFDILVKPEQKDSFNIIMQQTLNKLLPLKARLERKTIPVYVLKQRNDTTVAWLPSTAESNWGFSGQGFTGTNIEMKYYANYLSNEFEIPVVDETGLTAKYDITTENVLRSGEEIRKAAGRLGLQLEKSTREMNVLVFYVEK